MNQNPIISIEPETPDVSIEIKVSNEGKPGYTPQRGIDYWTDADKKEIVDDVKQEIGDLPGGGDAGNAVQWSDDLQYAGASDKATLGYAGYDSDALAYTARNGKTIVLPRSIDIGNHELMPDVYGIIKMPDEYNPVAAAADRRGGVYVGDGIEVDSVGRISVPLASNDGPAGLVCPGKGLEVKSGDLKVKYDEFVATREVQSLGEEAQTRARENIGAASAESVDRLTEEKVDKTFANVDDGAIPFDKLASVSATEISGAGNAASPNIAKVDTVTRGLIVANGAIEGASNAYYTEILPVKPGQTLRICNWGVSGTTAISYPGAEYDADGNFVARLATWKMTKEEVVVDGVDTNAYAFVLGANTHGIRLNIDGDALPAVMATLDELIPSTYMPYSEGSEAWNKEVYDVDPDNVRVKKSVSIPWGGFLDIAYSALWSYGPINTEMVYETAGFFGFDAIKGDVQISADNVLIMCHDDGFTLDENGKITTYNANDNTKIRTMQSADILALEHAMNDLGAHPCTIDDYLRICAKWGKIAFVTIRDKDIDVIAPILLTALKRWNLQHKAIINSFTLASLKTVRNLDRYVWVNQVKEGLLTDTDYNNAVSLYPCALSPYSTNAYGVTAEGLLAEYNQMATVVEKCKANGIPVLTAGGYTREQVEFHRAHYNGAQIHQITDSIPRRRYIITLARADGAWKFVRKFTFEHSGTITENGNNVDFTCDDILSTWLRYLYPSVKAVCTTDSSVNITASIAHDGTYIRVTPASVADGQQIMVTLDF